MSVSFKKDRNTALITHSTFSQWLPSQRSREQELSSLCVWRHENGRGCRAQVQEKPDKFKNLPETSETIYRLGLGRACASGEPGQYLNCLLPTVRAPNQTSLIKDTYRHLDKLYTQWWHTESFPSGFLNETQKCLLAPFYSTLCCTFWPAPWSKKKKQKCSKIGKKEIKLSFLQTTWLWKK